MNCNDTKNVRLHNVKTEDNENKKKKETRKKFYANWKLIKFISLHEAIDIVAVEEIEQKINLLFKEIKKGTKKRVKGSKYILATRIKTYEWISNNILTAMFCDVD